jgi:hypothetical protein
MLGRWRLGGVEAGSMGWDLRAPRTCKAAIRVDVQAAWRALPHCGARVPAQCRRDAAPWCGARSGAGAQASLRQRPLLPLHTWNRLFRRTLNGQSRLLPHAAAGLEGSGRPARREIAVPGQAGHFRTSEGWGTHGSVRWSLRRAGRTCRWATRALDPRSIALPRLVWRPGEPECVLLLLDRRFERAWVPLRANPSCRPA